MASARTADIAHESRPSERHRRAFSVMSAIERLGDRTVAARRYVSVAAGCRAADLCPVVAGRGDRRHDADRSGPCCRTGPAERRGGQVSLFQLVFFLGLLLSFFVGYLFSGTPECWRPMFMLGVIPALLLALGMMVLPESLRWLLHHQQERRAVSIL